MILALELSETWDFVHWGLESETRKYPRLAASLIRYARLLRNILTESRYIVNPYNTSIVG